MATTTNYGWTTPDDTALVKDGASAIRTLGSSVDTTVKNLNPETTLGDISYRSSTANTNTRLAIGSSGQVLTVSSGVPAWTTISSGGMTLISETTASALSSLSLSSIPGTYKQLLLIWGGIYHSASSNAFTFRLNNDSTAGIYAEQYGEIEATAYSGYAEYSSMGTGLGGGLAPFGYGTTSSTDYSKQAVGSLLIDDYASTTKYKRYKLDFSYFSVSTTYATEIWGVFKSTSAITSIDTFRFTGSGTFSNATNTSIRLYGVS